MMRAGVVKEHGGHERGGRITEEESVFWEKSETMKGTEERNSLREKSLKEAIWECI